MLPAEPRVALPQRVVFLPGFVQGFAAAGLHALRREHLAQGRLLLHVLEGGALDYKDIMFEKADAAGLSQKDVLDFLDAFRSITGKDMGDFSVDRKFILDKREQVKIGAEAFLASKLELQNINRLVEVFDRLTEHTIG